MKNKFSENFDVLKIAEIEMKLDNMLADNNYSISAVNEISDDISCIFEKCSRESFGTVHKTTFKHRRQFKHEWFDQNCRIMRNQYHRIRRIYNKNKNTYNKKLLKDISKQYKNILRKSHNKYNNVKIENLRKLKNANPKEYWRIINNASKNNAQPNASLSDLYNYFKQVNEVQLNNDEENNQPFIINEELNEEINMPINEQEILRAVKNLKNNKSPGVDNIINEQIKESVYYMLPTYIKLFNIIFNEGLIPETWTMGIIKPIYKGKGDPRLP
jgi:hypothetical protein